MYHLTYVFYSIINMPYISPFRCPKVLFGGKSPFQWQKSFSVFSRTRKTYLLINPIGHCYSFILILSFLKQILDNRLCTLWPIFTEKVKVHSHCIKVVVVEAGWKQQTVDSFKYIENRRKLIKLFLSCI